MKIIDLLEYELNKRQKSWVVDSKATILVSMPPEIFLKLTTTQDFEINNKDNHLIAKTKDKQFYQDLMNKEDISVHPFLYVDEKTGKIVGHEGRSRALAAIKHGDKEYEVAIIVTPQSRNLSIKNVPNIWTGQYNSGYKINFKQQVNSGVIKILDDNVQRQYQTKDYIHPIDHSNENSDFTFENTSINDFLNSKLKNQWIEYKNYSVYVRKGHHLINNDIKKTLDLASIESNSDSFGNFREFIRKMEEIGTQDGHFDGVYCESILNPAIIRILPKLGYEQVKNSDPVSFYKPIRSNIEEIDHSNIFYHGTNVDFDNFNAYYLGKKTDSGIWGSGFYFTNHLETAKGYGKKIYHVTLDIKNPLYLDRFKSTKELAEYLDISESILTKRDRATGVLLPYSRVFTSAIKDKGHDSVVVKDNDHLEIVVFSSKQISILDKISESWDRLAGNKTNIQPPKNIKLDFGVKDTHYGELFGYLDAYDISTEKKHFNKQYGENYHRRVAYMGWSKYENTVFIQMIEVAKDWQQKGLALAMVSRLQKEFPDKKIDFGMTTPEGQMLKESKSAPLYHVTSTVNAAKILTVNILGGNTTQELYGKEQKGVSLTRDIHFAKTFDNVSDISRIIFVLDQEKLNRYFKVIPVDFFMISGKVNSLQHNIDKKRRKGIFAEAEEFLIGSIFNFDKFLTKILVPKETYDFNENNLKTLDKGRPHSRSIANNWEIIKNHPKTEVLKK